MSKIRLGLAGLILISLFFAINAFADEGIVKIAAVEGKALVKISPAADWIEAKVGQMLNKKDAIKTEADGKAYLEFPDKTSMSLKPNTEIAIDELVWSDTARKVGIKMSIGELKTIIQKVDKPSEFKIKTPTAICGAQGTIFYVVVFANGTGVYVEEGLIDFLNTISGESYAVYKGNDAEAHNDGTSTAPRELTKEQVDQIISGYDMEVVAEPYEESGETPPGGDPQFAPEVKQEDDASNT